MNIPRPDIFSTVLSCIFIYSSPTSNRVKKVFSVTNFFDWSQYAELNILVLCRKVKTHAHSVHWSSDLKFIRYLMDFYSLSWTTFLGVFLSCFSFQSLINKPLDLCSYLFCRFTQLWSVRLICYILNFKSITGKL